MPMPRKPDPIKTCETCGMVMERKRFNGRLEDRSRFLARRYCSLECSAIAQQTETDAALSNRAKKYRKDRCEECGTTETLQVHHINEDRTDNHPSNLMTLCRSCHTKWHWKHGKKPYKEPSACRICGMRADGLGYCQKHRLRFKKYGDPLLTKKRCGSRYVLVRDESGTTPT